MSGTRSGLLIAQSKENGNTQVYTIKIYFFFVVDLLQLFHSTVLSNQQRNQITRFCVINFLSLRRVSLSSTRDDDDVALFLFHVKSFPFSIKRDDD